MSASAEARSPDASEGPNNMLDQPQLTVSIIVKALNEEGHIAAALESALAALDGLEGEVILADAASTDRTVEIAKRYPVTIVQLKSTHDRSCGAGAQLGFQYSRGRYLFLLDADMRVHPGFLPAAVRFLDANPDVAGVSGLNPECETSNLEFAQRATRVDPDRAPGDVTRLNGTGVYRRAAIEAIGYLTDRNLHGGEELDLGARLHAHGWRLVRIDHPGVDHYGHAGSAFRLLLRRMRSRNAFGTGEVLRAAIGRRHFWFILRHDNNLFLCALVSAWWLSIVAALFAPTKWHALVAVGLALFPFAAMSLRWRSLRHGIYSVTAWNVYTLGFLPGLLRARVPPTRWIESRIVERELAPVARCTAVAAPGHATRAAVPPQAV
jgi:glycosyltransferase involved in cell wall biosynthesis